MYIIIIPILYTSGVVGETGIASGKVVGEIEKDASSAPNCIWLSVNSKEQCCACKMHPAQWVI